MWREQGAHLAGFPVGPRGGLRRPCRAPVCGLIAWSLLVCGPAATAADLEFHFADRFDDAEQAKLKAWVTRVADATEQLAGPFGFPIHVHFERTGSSEPVPWARTLRGHRQGIRFYVDPGHSAEAFMKDWTAPHEFSHLLLPYLGSRNAWFAEGFASFMQYQVMHSMGVLDAAEAARRYRERLQRAERAYTRHGETFVAAAPRLHAERKYPTLYWGGAVFFFRLDARLRADADTGLLDLLRDYVACCRRNRAELLALIRDFDRLLGANQCADELAAFAAERGFPEYDHLEPGIVGGPGR
mgnify:FL=1